MPVTPNLTDPAFHPLDPRNATPVTPMEQLAIGGLNPYRSSYFEDFKAALGFLPDTLTPEEAVLRRENARIGFLRRNLAGGLAATRGAAMISAYVAGSTAVGGVGGLAVGGFIDATVGGLWKVSGLSALQENMRNRAFAEDIGQVVARGTGATLTGHGFKQDEIRELHGFLKDASGRFDVSLEDIQKDVVKYVNAGLFNNVSNVDEFKKQFGQLKKNVSDIIKVLGTTQEEAVQMMAEVNQSGISQGALAGGLQTAQLLSRRTGISIANFIGAGVSTAQGFQGTGISAGAGFNLGMGNVGGVQRGLQMGTISPNTMFQLGGSTENVAFAATRQQMGFLNSAIGETLMRAAMTPEGKIDMERFVQLAAGGDLVSATDAAYRNMQGRGYATWRNNQDMMKSALVNTLGENLNVAMLSSIRGYANRMGLDPQLAATQFGGFTNDTWRLIEGMVMASPGPGGTMQERDLARMARRGLMRQYQRGDTPWSDFWRTSAYEWGEFGGAAADPFRWVGNQVRNTYDYLTRPKGAIDYLESDVGVAERAMRRGGVDIAGIETIGGNVWTDETWGADASEIALADIRKGIVRESEIDKYSLKEIYNMDEVRKQIESLEGGVDRYKWGKTNLSNMMKVVQEALPGVQGFENALILEDRKMRYGAATVTVLKNKANFIAEGKTGKEMIVLAQILGRSDRSKIDALDAIGDQGLSRIQNRLYQYAKNNKKEFAAMGPEKKLMTIMERAGVSRETIQDSDQAQEMMNALLIAAENAGLGFDLKSLTETKYGSGIFGRMMFRKDKDKNLNDFTSKIDQALEGIGGDLGLEAKKYLKDNTTQALLNELYVAHDAEAGEGELQKRVNKIIRNAPDAAKADLRQLFNMNQEDLFKNFQKRFGIDEESLISQYEQQIFYKLDLAVEQFDLGGELTEDKIKENLRRAKFTDEEIAAMPPETISRIGAYKMLPLMRGRMARGGPGISTGANAVQEDINKQVLEALQALTQEIKGSGRKGLISTAVELYNTHVNKPD